jgi:hypothetical protein
MRQNITKEQCKKIINKILKNRGFNDPYEFEREFKDKKMFYLCDLEYLAKRLIEENLKLLSKKGVYAQRKKIFLKLRLILNKTKRDKKTKIYKKLQDFAESLKNLDK